MKTLMIRYRRWGLTLVVLLLPIIYNLLSNIIAPTQGSGGTFKMQATLLNPQTVLYTAAPAFEGYFQEAFGGKSSGLKFEKRTENIAELNRHIWRRFSSV